MSEQRDGGPAWPRGLRQAMKVALEASFDCGDWRQGDEEDYDVLHKRSAEARENLTVAIDVLVARAARNAGRDK